MSVEPLVLAALVEEETPRPAYMAGMSREDFEMYSDEFAWLEWRYENRKPINRRIFLEKFPKFEYVVPREPLTGLLDELKNERAYAKIVSLIETVDSELEPENAIDWASHMREVLGDVVRTHAPHADVSVKDGNAQYKIVEQNYRIMKAGESIGMPIGIPSIDYHWDGLIPGRLIGVLGRPGEGKSFLIAWICWQAIKNGYRLGLFSPEMNEFEHTCRLHTLASADPWVQEQVGLKGPFLNRDLMRGTVPLGRYKVFCDFFETLPGDCRIFTKKYRKAPLTVSYIAGRVDDLGLQGVIADPLSKLQTNIKRDSAVQEDYDRVGQFQELGETSNIFTVATNWANRGLSKGKAPDLDDSFGSDALAKESDHVISVKHDELEHELLLRCSKSRFGKPRFNALMTFEPNTGAMFEKDIPHDVEAGIKELEERLVSLGKLKKVKPEEIR